MGFSSAIDWWDEWKLRILILCSLFVQFFVFFFGYNVRTWYQLRRLRGIVWIANTGGEALAIYALATLFNRQKQQTADGGGNALQVMWAPVLLIHLGGQTVTAYSLEENKLWKRHVITLVSKVSVVLYIFCMWWPGEKRLLQAAVLLFVVGILRFSEKPCALRRASLRTVASSRASLRTVASSSLTPPRGETWSALCSSCTRFPALWQEEETALQLSEEEFVRKGLEISMAAPDSDRPEEAGDQAQPQLALASNIFIDLSAPYSIRLHCLQSFLNLDAKNQHIVLRQWIGKQFSTTYTKIRLTGTCVGFWLSYLPPSLALASVVLFAMSAKDGYNKSDIMVTYILFSATVVMEFAPFWFPLLCGLPLFRYRMERMVCWQDMVAQHNIMSFCARKKKPTTLMKLATISYLRDYINTHWYIWHELAAKQISMLVRHHAEHGWKEYICDAATYRRFNNLRGEHTLMKTNPYLLDQDKLGWTFILPFDEYVLLWHLATDLCIHQTTNDDASASTSQGAISSRRSSEIISNYMIYLLFICPEMLIPGVRPDLFMLACDDIERTIEDQPLPSLDERSIAHRVLCMGQDGDERMRESLVISNAYKLAKALIDLDNDRQRWEVIQGVWVEMLCYSASRCRGYEHSKSLALGGEFLTNVWLLWWCIGMQTLPDMMNNLGLPEEQTAAAASV